MTDEERKIREEFPIFESRDIVYLDNSATSQRPRRVLSDVTDFYEKLNSNPMRGLYDISILATEICEEARKEAAAFIGAKDPDGIIFTRNATESLNLVAYSYGETFLKEGDEIIVSIAEHHSNLLPWQTLAKKKGAKLVWFECEKDGSFSVGKFKELLSGKTALVAMTEMSNIFGRQNDIKAFAAAAHESGAVFVCDGAQSTPHIKVDVTASDVDFFAFSGHKMFAPMGIGVLYGKKKLLKKMPPFLYGGEMIEYVKRDSATFAGLPHKFEAGTINAGGAAGLLSAIRFIRDTGFENIMEREHSLTEYAMERMKDIPHVNIIGSADPAEHHGIITFTVDGVHPHDIAEIMNSKQICIRAGHHCAQPLLEYLGVRSTARASIGYYNTFEDIDRFIAALEDLRKGMGLS